jgi:hypothetical protein
VTEIYAGAAIPDSKTLSSVLLVPGAWHKPDHFDLLVDELSGLDAHTVALTGRSLWSRIRTAACPRHRHSRTRETSDASSTSLHTNWMPVSRVYPPTGVR